MSNEVEAGRATDERIAVEVMGWEVLRVGYLNMTGPDGASARQIELDAWLDHVGIESVGTYFIDVANGWWVEVDERKFSTDISAAWQVVEKMHSWQEVPGRPGFSCALCIKVGRGDGAFVEVFDLSPMGYVGQDDVFEYFSVEARTAPLAICRAALKAVATTPESEIPGPHGEPRT